MKCILNIGLVTSSYLSKPPAPVDPARALSALLAMGFNPEQSYVAQSTTEPTLVVHGDDSALRMGGFWELARLLDQDCVAVWYTNREEGRLIGPRSDKWGEFNPAYFISKFPWGERHAEH